MIATVTLNASIDKMYRLEGPVLPGSVMRVASCRNSAGGKGLNVARVLSLCGESVTAAGLAGGHNGGLLKELLKKDKIPGQFVDMGQETRCCINIITPDQKSTEFLEPGPEVGEEVLEEFICLFCELASRCDIITLSGSVPRGIPADIYKILILSAREYGKKVILDTSGELLKEGLKAGPELVKPNLDEMEALLETRLENFQDVAGGALDLHKMGIPYVAVSLGREGAMLACSQGVYHGRPPAIQAVNTVGCGDSMVAAFAAGLRRGYSVTELLRYGVAVSAANALSAQTGDFNEEDLERILPEVEVRRVSPIGCR